MWEDFEKRSYLSGYAFPVGVDEAGRGPLAGPVVAASCYLPKGLKIEGLGDSKTLTEKRREKVASELRMAPGVFIGVGLVSAEAIDETNILIASLDAMMRSVRDLPIVADFLLIDGNRMPESEIPGEAVVKGDGRVRSIAAASIIAKVLRDEIMRGISVEYPEYGFEKHKGYPTKVHKEAIECHGPCPYHRKSFSPLKEMYNYS